jgi:hypothetical protein
VLRFVTDLRRRLLLRLVAQIFPRWNRVDAWLREAEGYAHSQYSARMTLAESLDLADATNREMWEQCAVRRLDRQTHDPTADCVFCRDNHAATATANACVSDTTSHSCQRRRITVG